MEGHRVKLTEINPYLVCVLCQGYLVDATTVAECLHSFCRSCIFRQLSRESVCPICKTQVHNTKLYRSLRPDKTLQDIVYKLVPGLFHNEMQRRREFYKKHPYRDEHLEPECRGVCLDRLIYSPKDQISLSLEIYDEEREKEEWSNHQSSPKPAQTAPSGPKRYLQCPAGFKMYHLKKFLRQKYGLNPSCNIDIMYRREWLPDSYSLMDVAYIYTWKRNSPMRFYYRMPEVIMKQLMAPPRELPRLTNGDSEKKDEMTDENKNKTQETTCIDNSSDSAKPEKGQENAQVKKQDIGVKEESAEKENNNKKEDDPEVSKEEDKVSNGELVTSKSLESQDVTIKEDLKTKTAENSSSSPNESRQVSKHDELPVSVLLSLSQSRVDNSKDHKFVVPQALPPKNGIIDKKPNKISLKLTLSKTATDLGEQKSQHQNNENIRVNAQIPQQSPPQKQKPIVPKPTFYNKPKHIQPKQPHMTTNKQQMLLLKQQHQQQKQQQLLQQKQQIQQIIKQQQELQQQIEQQQQQLQLQQQQKYLQKQQQLQQQQQKYQIQQQQMHIQQIQMQQQQQLRHQFQNQGIPLSPQQRPITQQNQSPLIQHIIYDGHPIQVQQSLQQPQILQITQQQQQPQAIQINSQSGQFAQVQRPTPAQQNTSPKVEIKVAQNASNNSLNNKDQAQVPNSPILKSKEKETLDGKATMQQDPPKNAELRGASLSMSEQTASSTAVEKSITPPTPALPVKTPPLQCTPPPLLPTPPPLRTPPHTSQPTLGTPPPQIQASLESAKTSQPPTIKSPQLTGPQKQKGEQPDGTRPNSGVEHVQSSIAHMSGGNVNFNPVATSGANNGLKPDKTDNILNAQLKVLSQPQVNQPQQQGLSVTETNSVKGSPQVQSPQVTLNTSNGSVTIMAQPKNNQNISSPSPNSTNSPASVNGNSPDSPRPQGVHQNLPRTVLPNSPFVNGKPTQKAVQQKNISGQRLNNNITDLKNGLIQQTNINNRLPTFPKAGGGVRKSGSPGVVNKSGPTLEQRIQQLYKSGQTSKPPSPNGKSESRLANWLTNRFKAQSPKEEVDPSPPAPPTKEVSMIRYKRKLSDIQNGQEVCEITQENPRPDDAKRRREVMPDVSIELMRAADIKKLEGSAGKKEKRPVPGLKSIQEVSVKRKKEDESVLDLSSAKPGDLIQPQLPWVMNRPPHFIPRPT